MEAAGKMTLNVASSWNTQHASSSRQQITKHFMHPTDNLLAFDVPKGYLDDHFLPWAHAFTSVIPSFPRLQKYAIFTESETLHQKGIDTESGQGFGRVFFFCEILLAPLASVVVPILSKFMQ